MKLSLLHATKRPTEGKKCQQLWLDRADNRANIEIITCIDADDEACKEAFPDAVISPEKTACAAWNEAAKHATGDILVVLDDDWICPPAWDQIIESYVCNGADILHVGDERRKDDLICHPIVSRRYYETIGYIWAENFKSVYCDNWFTTMAKNWGYVDATQGGKVDLGFLHANPSQGFGVEDEVARVSNSKERYAHGKAVMERLVSNNVVLAFTACDRPHFLSESLASWEKTNLSLVTSVQFFIEPTDKLDAIHSVIDIFESNCPVPVIRHVNPEKYGVLRNPWELFHNLFDKQLATAVVMAEDDFLVSPDILRLFEHTRKHAQPKTLAICAKNVGESADENPATFTYDKDFSGNIWMTWAEKWRAYLKTGWDMDYSSGTADGTSSGFDWNIGLRVMPKNGLRCLVPTASRSWHVGSIGVHTTSDTYNGTTTWNFVREPYLGAYSEKADTIEPVKVKKVATLNTTTAGDIGDALCCLPSIIARGEVVNFLLRDNGQTKGIVGRMHLIKELFESQPLINECREWQESDQVHWKSEDFRSMGMHGDGTSLAGVHAACARRQGFIDKEPDYSQPWLTVEPDDRWNGRVVINRTDRYNNPYFPWKRIVDHYGDKITFIGTPHEHDMFQRSFGLVEHVPTANMLIAAKMIAGSSLYIGNQSSCMCIAEGLKHPRIQEVCLWLPDCIYSGFGAQYSADGSMTLPAVGDTPELVIERTKPSPEVNINETPPGCWQFPDCPPSMHPHAAVQFIRSTVHPEWSKEQALAELVAFNTKRRPDWFNHFMVDPELKKFMVAKRNAGLA